MELHEKHSYCEIKRFCKEIEGIGNPVFYRGTKVEYLLPSIVPLGNKLDIIHLLKIEEELLRTFKILYPHNFDEDEITIDWLYRIRAREYGLASRLLDWSNSYYKALDFATKDIKSDDVFSYLWILKMNINELVFLNDLKNYKIDKLASTIMLRGIKYNNDDELATHRQLVQGGNFLVQPSFLITTPLNKQSSFMDRLVCIKINGKYIDEIRKDIIKIEHEDVNQSLLIIEDNCIDVICKTLNNKLLYSVNESL